MHFLHIRIIFNASVMLPHQKGFVKQKMQKNNQINVVLSNTRFISIYLIITNILFNQNFCRISVQNAKKGCDEKIYHHSVDFLLYKRVQPFCAETSLMMLPCSNWLKFSFVTVAIAFIASLVKKPWCDVTITFGNDNSLCSSSSFTISFE